MKGGKGGRKRRSPGSGAKRAGSAKPGASPAGAARKWSELPKKGVKIKPKFGGSSSSEDEGSA